MAGVIGRKWGQPGPRVASVKSHISSSGAALAGFCSTLLVHLINGDIMPRLGYFFLVSIFGEIYAALAKALRIPKINYNLAIPIFIGFLLTVASPITSIYS